eukprot:4306529-Pyramimonas_sp.AAC.1
MAQWPSESSTWLQDGPMRPHKRPKRAPRRLQKRSESAPRGAQETMFGLPSGKPNCDPPFPWSSSKMAPRGLPRHPRQLQEAPKTPPGGPNRPREAPR